MWLLFACADPAEEDAEPGTDGKTPATTAASLEEAVVALPFATVGDTAPSATLEFDGEWSLDGAFRADAESGTLTITLDADMDTPALHEGTLTVGEQTVPVVAVVGAAELPALVWTEDDWGAWAVGDFATAPYPYEGSSYTDASVLVAVPPHLGAITPLGTVLHLHGHNASVPEVAGEQFLREQLGLSGRNAVLALPQGPVEAADSDFGRLETTGAAAALLRDVVSVVYRDGWTRRATAEPVVLTSHSGGYQATASILQRGGVAVDSVHLFDSVYANESVFADYAADGRLVSVYTSGGGTDDNNRALRDSLEDAGVFVATSFDDATLDRARVVIGLSAASHSACVWQDRNYARWLRASGLPAAPAAPPELRSVVAVGDQVTVTWRDEVGLSWVVETSADGENWVGTPAETASSTLARAPWVRVHAGGAPSDTYGATGDGWWIVDGFDRVLGGSWTAPTHGFAADVLWDSGLGASVVSNEAVADGSVDLRGAEGVIWLLGDESTADHSFDTSEQTVIEGLVDAGVPLILSGSEVGYSTDADWLLDTLGVSYVSDDAGTVEVEDFTIGVAYPEDYPDVLAGEETIWRYGTGGGAAVRGEGGIVVGFGVETIAPDARARALVELIDAL